jgi:tetratricopeptide (TPR) repeat protein
MKKGLSFIVFFLAVVTFLFFQPSLKRSLADGKIFKQLAKNGPNNSILYPLGSCISSVTQQSMNMVNVPKDASHYYVGLSAINNGNLDKADNEFEQLIKQGSVPISDAYVTGILKLLEGKDSSVFFKQSKAFKRWLLLGDECVETGNQKLADAYYHLALESIDQSDVAGYSQLVEYFAGKNDVEAFTQALNVYQSIAEPESLDYLWTMGRVYSKQNQPSRALEFYQIILEKTPNDPLAWYYSGQEWVAVKNYEQAQSCFNRAIQLDPQNANYYIYLGHTYRYQNQYEQAGIWYEKALSISPTSDWAMVNLAEVRYQEGRFQEAFDLAIRTLAFDNRPYVRALISKIALKMGNFESARKYIEEAISLDSENLDYLQQLNAVCESLQDQSCLLQTNQQILKLDPNNVNAQQVINKITGENP